MRGVPQSYSRESTKMTTLAQHLLSFLTGGVGGAIVVWLAQHLLAERLAHEYALKLESH